MKCIITPKNTLASNMTIFGIGAYFSEDVTNVFLKKKVACVGWNEHDAPALHKIMAHIKVGDIIYIKKYPPNEGLTIKAIGIVADDKVTRIQDVGEACVKVKWVWKGPDEFVGKIDDKYIVHTGTLYEEYNPNVQEKIIDLLTARLR